MSNLRYRSVGKSKEEEDGVRNGTITYATENLKKEEKKSTTWCTGRKCFKGVVAVTLPTLLAALTQLGHKADILLHMKYHINSHNIHISGAPTTNVQTVEKTKLWEELHKTYNITNNLKTQIKILEKELEKERQEVLKQKALVKHHANQGVIGAVSKGIKSFVGL